MRLPTGASDGPIPSEAYDPALKEIFISDPNFNSVEVYSTVNGKLVGEISIPAPAGLCFSPNFSQLFVGTVTPYIYVVDPTVLHVTKQIQVPSSQLTASAQGTTMMPVMPFAMADGSLVLGMGYNSQSGSYAGTGIVHLLQYQPSGNRFTSIDPGAGGLSANPARSLDGEFLLVFGLGNSGLELVVYSIATQSYLSASTQLQNGGVFLAANPDGSQFASVQEVVAPGTGSFNSQVNFWGANLQPQTQYTINAVVTGALYSRDGKYLYLMTNLGYLVVLGAQSGTPVGYMSLVIGSQPLPAPPIYDVDETYHLFGAAAGSAFILNASQPQSSTPSAIPQFVGLPSTEANPNVGPLSGGTQVQFIPAPTGSGSADGIASSMEAYFGAIPAPQDTVAPYPASSDGENFLTATAPVATAPGPVSVVLTDASNNAAFLPDAYTYGPHVLRIEPSAASIAGGDRLTIYAYGLGFFSDLLNIQVTIGGTPVNMKDATLNSYASANYPEQSVTVSAPPGTPGWADVVVKTNNGSDTLKRAIQYLKQEVKVRGGPYSFVVYDSTRNLFYLTGSGNAVAVFNPSTQVLEQPLQSTFASAGAVLQAEVLTTDSSTLLVADPTDQLVIIFNLVTNTSTKVGVALSSDPPGTLLTPRTIVAAANNRAFVSVAPCVTDPIREIDLTNLTVQARPDATSACATYVPYPELGAGSADGSTIVYAGNSGDLFGLQPSGPEYLWRYAAASDSFSGPLIVADLPWMGGQAALSRDGGVIALTQGALDQRLLPLVPILQPREDGRLNETGSLLYGVSLESNEIVLSDIHNGRPVLRLAAQNSNGTVIGLGPIRPLAIDPTGAQVVLGLQDGIAYFQLATIPLAVGTISPATAPFGGTIQLNGSGFAPGTTATIGGKSAICTQVNAETLSCTVPNLASGVTSISLTNPDGQSYSLENAFSVQ
jgi:IPT/TIG domain-containing protein